MAEPGGPEDQKPQSDEARSAFVPPAGVGRPAGPPEEDHPTSEFALPAGLPTEPQGSGSGPGSGSASGSGSGSDTIGSAFAPPRTYSARESPPAFTPAHGIPMVRLTKEAPWQDRMRTMLRMPVAERPAPEPVQKHDDVGPAVPRVLDLTLRIGELLLAGGEGAEDVEAAMFAVTRSYGLDRCEPTVTFTLLSISHQPSLVDDPVTASRTVRRRGTDYTRLAAVFRLIDDITHEDVEVSLEEAYRRLAEIRRNRHPYPGWVLTLAGQPAAVITGGLFALLPGRALVAGVQDGLTGYYITAAARLLEVMYFFIGIVTGVLLVLYLGLQLGGQLNPEARFVIHDRPVVQILASMALCFAFAILLQQERSTVLAVTLNGGVAWVIYGAMARTAGISPVAATAVAAGLVGLFGQLLSRYRYTSSLPFITAAIGPLLPGSATYFGLLGVAQNRLDQGLASLSAAVATALAIAIGVNLGSEISRLFMRVPGAVGGANRRAAKRTRGF